MVVRRGFTDEGDRKKIPSTPLPADELQVALGRESFAA
jgi:hypothetical protein